MKNKKKDTYHVISNTHWDREWRYPFERNRQKLVEMIDHVLDILESNPDYRAFHLDSQSIVLKDYLEIKPHNKNRIVRLTQAGRLLHGPWYVLPDQFLVGGESLIRNLLLGHKISKELGGVTKTGYSPFSWGQIAQLPQIYNQFGIELIMFYRGVNSLDSPKAEFVWRGADGTEMLSSRFSTMPRYNFYFYIYRPVVFNQQFEDLENAWNDHRTAFHLADRSMFEEDYFLLDKPTTYFPENIRPGVERIINDQAEDFTTSHKIWMEGHDSSGPHAITPKIIRDIQKEMPEINVLHSTLLEYASALKSEIDYSALKIVEGERRSAQNDKRCTNLYGYVTSARMYLKQAHFNAERWIQYYAEPFNGFAGMLGMDMQDEYPEKAWDYILQNSAHDSIGGCSLDTIHDDMMVRYRKSIEISKGLFERSMKYLVKQLNTASYHSANEADIYLVALNPVNDNRSDVVEAILDIPVEMDKGDLIIKDESGNIQPLHVIEKTPCKPLLDQLDNRPMYFSMMRYKILVQPTAVDAFGLKVFHVIPVKKNPVKVETNHSTTISNDFLEVQANSNGTFNITDKENNRTYYDQGYFVDEGEAGHAWVHEKMEPVISTIDKKAEIQNVCQGDLLSELHIKHTVDIPLNLKERQEEEPKMEQNEIHLTLRLAKGCKHLEIKIDVDNHAESHRLRMLFPLQIQAKVSCSEGQFNVVERQLERPQTEHWIEQPMYDYPMHHFVDVSDKEKGVALLIDGLKEYEVLDDHSKTLAMTLLRTFEYKINPAAPQDFSADKGSQMLGKSSYRMAFYPHEGNWIRGKVYNEAFAFNYPLKLVQTGALNGNLNSSLSFMQVEPDELIISAFKKPESGEKNAYILRLFNPQDKAIEGKVRFLSTIKIIHLLTLEEIKQYEIPAIDSHSFEIQVEAKKIQTYLIQC